MGSLFEYKDFVGSNYFSYMENVYAGRILWIKRFVLYKNPVKENLRENFINAVDAYIETNKNPKSINNIRFTALVDVTRSGIKIYHNELPIAVTANTINDAKEKLVDQMVIYVKKFNSMVAEVTNEDMYRVKKFCLFVKDVCDADKSQIMKVINFINKDVI